ncbi:hypothetical protein [Pseudonocardia sp.]|jgi:hypothetical protein|uniref:hypothetical protein n=1 Tax=Pseudonocardia sp. TaxID=60912 RepID=UPI003D0F0497
MAGNDDDLGRSDGLPLADEQRDELLARQARLVDARAAAEAAQQDRDEYIVDLDDAGVGPGATAAALGLLRASVERVLTDRRAAETAQRLAADVPRAAARSALDRAQERVDQAWKDAAD